MTPIDLRYYSDAACTAPDPAGLYFRASLPAEVADTSLVVAQAWVRWVAYWGGCKWRIVAWDAHGPIAEADYSVDHWELPHGVRGFTVEGWRENAGVQPAVALLELPHA